MYKIVYLVPNKAPISMSCFISMKTFITCVPWGIVCHFLLNTIFITNYLFTSISYKSHYPSNKNNTFCGWLLNLEISNGDLNIPFFCDSERILPMSRRARKHSLNNVLLPCN